MIYDNIVG